MIVTKAAIFLFQGSTDVSYVLVYFVYVSCTVYAYAREHNKLCTRIWWST